MEIIASKMSSVKLLAGLVFEDNVKYKISIYIVILIFAF